MQHRIVNSLQIIASILMLKARAVTSEETRQHLQDAHRRVMSVAAVQEHLHGSERHDLIEIGPYLSKLCERLAASMIGDRRPSPCRFGSTAACRSAEAVSLGLIVTELVINALKYAFPDAGQDGGSWSATRSTERTGSFRLRQWHRAPDAAATRQGRAGHQPGQGARAGTRCRGRSRQRPGRRERVAHPRSLPLAAPRVRLTSHYGDELSAKQAAFLRVVMANVAHGRCLNVSKCNATSRRPNHPASLTIFLIRVVLPDARGIAE